MDPNDLRPRGPGRLRQATAHLRHDMNARFERVDARMASTEAGMRDLHVALDRVGQRVTDAEVRLSTEIQALTGMLRDVHSLLVRGRRRVPED